MMRRYKKEANSVLSIELNKEYIVMAFIKYSRQEEQYYVSLYLKHKKIDMLSLMEKYENIVFSSKREKINEEVVRSIQKEKKNFAYYIERYEYEQECFAKGNELLERKIKKNV